MRRQPGVGFGISLNVVPCGTGSKAALRIRLPGRGQVAAVLEKQRRQAGLVGSCQTAPEGLRSRRRRLEYRCPRCRSRDHQPRGIRNGADRVRVRRRQLLHAVAIVLPIAIDQVGIRLRMRVDVVTRQTLGGAAKRGDLRRPGDRIAVGHREGGRSVGLARLPDAGNRVGEA